MNDKRVYAETVKLIWYDMKNILLYVVYFGVGLFIGAFGFFIVPLGIKVHKQCKFDKKYEDTAIFGEILGAIGLVSVMSGIGAILKSAEFKPNWTLVKVTIVTHGLYSIYFLGGKLREYVQTKEKRAIEMINKKKRNENERRTKEKNY